MADKADIGNDYAARLIDQQIAQRVRFEGVSRHRCIDCDEDIPAARRQSITGCTRCAPCQAEEERWQARR